jgi:hypothetical protein
MYLNGTDNRTTIPHPTMPIRTEKKSPLREYGWSPKKAIGAEIRVKAPSTIKMKKHSLGIQAILRTGLYNKSQFCHRALG